MITTTLNALKQTRHLGGSISTGIYDDGELEGLLSKTVSEVPREERGTQFLSPGLLSQLLSGEFIASRAERAEKH